MTTLATLIHRSAYLCYIQTLATDVATKITGAIGPAIDEALTKNLIPIIQGLQTKIKESIEESRKQQLQILGGLVF